jgi:hypothetical protein
MNSFTNDDLSDNAREALSRLEKHFEKDTSSVCCKKFRLKSLARDVTINEKWIYSAYICTLAEQRWPTRKSVVYNGNEICPNNPVGDIWQDYEFDSPKTTVLDVPALCISKDLKQTRCQEECPHCQNNQQTQCSHCKGRHLVVTWTQLNVKWSNTSSILFFPSDQNFCPQSIIQTPTKKIKCLEFDDIWPPNRITLDSIFERCNDLPEGLRIEINRKFLVHQRTDKILRLRCVIERFRVEKINYRLSGSQGKEINIKKIFLNI